jgi:hypothetical protein
MEGRTIVLIEDVVTSGGQVVESAKSSVGCDARLNARPILAAPDPGRQPRRRAGPPRR